MSARAEAPPMPDPDLQALAATLASLCADARALARGRADAVRAVHSDHRRSAENLLHYVAIRRRDLRPLQASLTELGLSSLGRCEAHVMATLCAVARALAALAELPPPENDPKALSPEDGGALLHRNTERLLGKEPARREVRILVTAPEELARDLGLTNALVSAGTDALRVNCAHDDEATWARMIQNMRAAAHAAGRTTRVLMDLPGPKLRTGGLAAGPRVLKIRPRRDAIGKVVRPAHVLLRDPEHQLTLDDSLPEHDAMLPCVDSWVRRLTQGRVIEFKDARGKRRRLDVAATGEGWAIATLAHTAYFTTGLQLGTLDAHWGASTELLLDTCSVGLLPAVAGWIDLKPGDELVVTIDAVTAEHMISCTLPQVFALVREGERVLFDDGKIAGTIVRREPKSFVARIDRTPPAGAKLRNDKGINLPDTRFDLPGLTEADLRILPFVATNADVLALSFLDDPSDVTDLLEALTRIPGNERLGIVLKIETRRAFEQLPLVLLEALRWQKVGVMIARGDLAVECGFERLAEIQEEILWICEAAHVPVIWATQVLETLAKTGMPSRAEITDAAMAQRAECVMLNKGPHLLAAVRTLDDILQRMQAHQDKKRQTFRQLSITDLRPR